jgi:small multidrug resistance pump
MDALAIAVVIFAWLVLVFAVLGVPVLAVVLVVLAAVAAYRRLTRGVASVAALRAGLRVGDRDRTATLRRLGDQFAVGRLTLPELEQRVEGVWAARTEAELRALEDDLPPGFARSRLEGFRPWLAGAALYNLLWGAGVVLLGSSVAWKVVGMLVLVYAPAYWWASRDPERHAHLVAVGLLGKLLGTLGFVWAAMTGRLPLAFGLVVLANDVAWLPAFGAFVRRAAQAHGGWKTFLQGA